MVSRSVKMRKFASVIDPWSAAELRLRVGEDPWVLDRDERSFNMLGQLALRDRVVHEAAGDVDFRESARVPMDHFGREDGADAELLQSAMSTALNAGRIGGRQLGISRSPSGVRHR